MQQLLVHVTVGKEFKKKIQLLIDSGFFTNNAEIVREGLRDFLSKYPNKRDQK